jgi:hypothetical protein
MQKSFGIALLLASLGLCDDIEPAIALVEVSDAI